MKGPNTDQQLLILEIATKAKLRKHLTRRLVGFEAITCQIPHAKVHHYCLIGPKEFAEAAERSDVTPMKAYKYLTTLASEGRIVQRPLGWRPHENVVQVWAQEVIDSLRRCGLPFEEDLLEMENARAKANEERARRREMMRAQD